jgi:hypothetical protein
LPSHAIGILSLIVLAVAIFGRYARSLAGAWLRAYEKVRGGYSRSAAPEDPTPVKCRRIEQRFWDAPVEPLAEADKHSGRLNKRVRIGCYEAILASTIHVSVFGCASQRQFSRRS